MIYRPYGPHQISALGIGLCQSGDLMDPASLSESVAALELGLTSGVNYVDLGFPHNCQDPQYLKACGELVKKYGAYTAVNINVLPEQAPLSLESEVRRCMDLYGLEHAAFLQYYGVGRVTWNRLLQSGTLDQVRELKRSGLIESVSLYYTDDRFYLKPILETGLFDAIALELSMIELPRNTSCLKIAADYNIAAAAHGTLKHMRLCENLTGDIQAAWDREKGHGALEWAMGIALSAPNVSCALAGARTRGEMERLCAIASHPFDGVDAVRAMLVGKYVRDALYQRRKIQCEICRSCMPCPLGVNAPRIAELYNEYLMFGNLEIPAAQYRLEALGEKHCIQCGKCRRKCPREFPLDEIVPAAHELFSSKDKECVV